MSNTDKFLDKNGVEITEFSVIKIFHFLGVNRLGRGRKRYYMYKWVQIRNGEFVALHLSNGSGEYCHLKYFDRLKDSVRLNCEIVQNEIM